MIEAAKEILDMVKHMPEYTLWVLVGILFYKVVIIGSWFGIARLVIVKLHDAFTVPRKNIIEHTLLNKPIDEKVESNLNAIIHLVIRRDKTKIYQSDFIHESDTLWLKEAVMDKLKKDGLI